MNRQLIYLSATVLIAIVLGTLQGRTQDEKKLTTKDDTWQAAYTVTIKGEGKIGGALGEGGTVIHWKVDRTYTGSADLNFGDNPWYTAASARKAYAKKLLEPKPNFVDSAAFQRARINDSMLKELPPGPCGEEESIETEFWKRDVAAGFVFSLASLTIDNANMTHDALLPVQIINMDMPMGLLTPAGTDSSFSVIYKRNSEPEVVKKGKNIEIPNIKDWLEDGKIVRKNKPLVQESPLHFFADSGEITVDESVLADVNTSGKVKIRITYSLTLKRPLF